MSEKIFGSELLFLGVGVGLVFFDGFCQWFCFMFWRVAPESVWQNSLDVRSVFFWLCSLFFWFFRRRRVCFSRFRFCFSGFSFKRDQVITGHPHTHLCLLFLFFLSRRIWCFARFGRASCFLAFFRGAILGPACFWDSPGTHGA